MEIGLWNVYSFVLGTSEVGAQTLLGSTQSFAAKLDAVERLFVVQDTSRAGPADEYADLFLKIFKGAREANTFRNVLAHGLYLTDSDHKELWVVAYLTDPSRKKWPAFELTAPFLQNKTVEIGSVRESCFFLTRFKKPEAYSET